MKFKTLTEKLNFILNELSDDTKQSLLDKRLANVNDAQAKLNKANELVNRSTSRKLNKPTVETIKNGTYKGEIGLFVLENIDEFSVDELVTILQISPKFNRVLFPSGFHYELQWGEDELPCDKYPAKLAEALAKSTEAETIADIYNIYYRQHGDLDVWGDAQKVWAKYATEQDAIEQLVDVYCPEYYAEVTNLLYEKLPKLAAKIDKECLKYNRKAVSRWIEERDN